MVDVLVTGGAGFIGSHFVRHALAAHPDWRVTTLDTLTAAGRLENLHDAMDHPRHRFVRGDITDAALVASVVSRAGIVVHFAAETDAERSVDSAEDFIRTDVFGTFVLLDAACRAGRLTRFIQVSPGEVYGTRVEGTSAEADELKPENPGAASRAGADRLAYSFWAAHRLPVTIARAARTFGPCQGTEQLMPHVITRAFDALPVVLAGDGLIVRDWLHVDDHCRALDLLIERGQAGEVYNIGGGQRLADIGLARAILGRLDRPESLIQPGSSRPAEGRCCCLDTSKLRQLGWAPTVPFEEGLADTVSWYTRNEWWWRPALNDVTAGM
jgi:dTDP-glucose 4,6-dehydratase